MNAQLAFEVPPLARATDPLTSHEAAERVRPASKELVALIRECVRLSPRPLTAFDIAYAVSQVDEFRWSEATIRTAVSRSGLRCVDADGLSPRGQRCTRYSL